MTEHIGQPLGVDKSDSNLKGLTQLRRKYDNTPTMCIEDAIREAYALGLEEAAKIAVPLDVIKGTSSYIEGYREGQSYIVTEIRKLIASRKEE